MIPFLRDITGIPENSDNEKEWTQYGRKCVERIGDAEAFVCLSCDDLLCALRTSGHRSSRSHLNVTCSGHRILIRVSAGFAFKASLAWPLALTRHRIFDFRFAVYSKLSKSFHYHSLSYVFILIILIINIVINFLQICMFKFFVFFKLFLKLLHLSYFVTSVKCFKNWVSRKNCQENWRGYTNYWKIQKLLKKIQNRYSSSVPSDVKWNKSYDTSNIPLKSWWTKTLNRKLFICQRTTYLLCVVWHVKRFDRGRRESVEPSRYWFSRFLAAKGHSALSRE